MKNSDLMKRKEKAMPKGFAIGFPFFADRAKNAEIWDVEGNRYIDFIGGIGVLNTGHTHPKITAAVKAQIDKFSHTATQVVGFENIITLAEKVCEKAPISGDKKAVFFSTGAEAVENAVKIARAATKRFGVIAFDAGYHGRTIYTLAMTGKVAPYKQDFGVMPGGIFRIPFPVKSFGVTEEAALIALEKLFKTDIAPTDVAAIIFEPIQGEGGFHFMPPAFAKKLREIADKHGIKIICDEVQSGYGRSGTFFATEQLGIEPDLMTTAKSLAGGYPLSGVIGKADIMDSVSPGGLGGTYAGSPVAVAAALAVLEVFEEENLLQRSNDIGKKVAAFLDGLKSKGGVFARIGEIRHRGAMLAFDILDAQGKPDADTTKSLAGHARDNGLMLATCGLFANSIRVLVPLTVEENILDEALGILEKSLAAVLK
ncbi:aspartate aminotransferase family protein [Commensalibacter papalotli (ex Botero et al. 2024)]|uniref:Acetylornithine aminotransferase/4-aminobutyrate aminotransferase (ArgD) (PDB:1SF2) n=1 Tax=Commensalibacter papalotli (ex Botero et al. 2024) TaxID=2972766 RepID=A0ABM9HLZ1_9PROT|nr:aminotransferase class III-fold pyridoxal phosphate-dependent enzyme [Commensalibacter papalotli (ex Botero et al. 2024)]CAI3935598.1 Acetylornithine aminotransferase/4-aminobutyrate aminotransferase (ArgD) (PDB:1SF2) [Commensalibacter papalotli (ex Botero et al. 2024)]CAI3951756.1 Acetylornithine aminotransferase/4-aminobutyrate aminotransferase (ArgD) (PDB:1SF2) [Commensalibacter papalotli (ex Botero et al. 2024)]